MSVRAFRQGSLVDNCPGCAAHYWRRPDVRALEDFQGHLIEYHAEEHPPDPEPETATPERVVDKRLRLSAPWGVEARAEALRQWFPEDLRPTAWLGVDVGWVFPAVDSDGKIYRWSRSREPVKPSDVTPAGPVTIRKANGKTVVRPPYELHEMADVFGKAEDESYRLRLRGLASTIVATAHTTGRGLALEDWRDFRRRRTRWVDVWRAIMFLAPERSVVVRTVKSAYTSQTCPMCGHVARGNRPRRNDFRCESCGHAGQSDRIAAVNISGKAEHGDVTRETVPGCSNPACSRVMWKAKLCVSCYFSWRRNGFLPDAAQIRRLAEARDAAHYLRVLDA